MRCAATLLAAAALAGGAGACGGNDAGADPEEAEDYVLEVEAKTDEVTREANTALRELGRLAQGAATPDAVITELELAAVNVNQDETAFHALTPPDAAEASSQDLNFAVADLATSLDPVASDIHVAERTGDVGDAARDGSRLILVSLSGISSLSQAIRSLATESAD